jgi:hypothetical protein
LQDQTTEFFLYTTPNGEVKVEVLLSNETLWLTKTRTGLPVFFSCVSWFMLLALAWERSTVNHDNIHIASPATQFHAANLH